MINTFFIIQENKNFELYIRLIEVLIWPLTLLVIILMFRKNFVSAFKRLGSFEASATGISMTFQEVADQAMELAQNVKPIAIAKSAVSLHRHDSSHDATPFEQVAEVQHEIEQTVNRLAENIKFETLNYSNSYIARKLEERGEINYKQYKLIESIESLISLSDKNITQKQVDDIKRLKNALIKTT
ncbi:hypothetical protein SAMN03097699_0897 [Flavobacteriaceae bacterium MAR_2010_188]|nr:hypothetical protein SAMN03097699_0897 [Flavobacteriaceae bacterium MAR_2010_188]